MYRCELCFEWIHLMCLPRKSDMCSKCTRSRRPILTQVISLLVELQDQKLHIIEGEFLQALIVSCDSEFVSKLQIPEGGKW